MRIFIAIKAFLKALRYPDKAQIFLNEKDSLPKEKAQKEKKRLATKVPIFLVSL